MDIALSPMQTPDGMLVLSAITDITDRKVTEQALIDLNARLLAANEQIRMMKEELEREQITYKHESGWNRAMTRLLDGARRSCGC